MTCPTGNLIDRHRNALVEALAPLGRPENLGKEETAPVSRSTRPGLEDARRTGDVHANPHPCARRQGSRRRPEDTSPMGFAARRRKKNATAPKKSPTLLSLNTTNPSSLTSRRVTAAPRTGPTWATQAWYIPCSRNGIPVVLASHFRCTEGSVTLTSAFYVPLLAGVDVRAALHSARVALREEARPRPRARHDWLSGDRPATCAMPAKLLAVPARVQSCACNCTCSKPARRDVACCSRRPRQHRGGQQLGRAAGSASSTSSASTRTRR